MNIKFNLFLISIILYVILVKANNENSLPECEKIENICILKNKTKLLNGNRCINQDGDIYESTNSNDGGCKLAYKLDDIYEMLRYAIVDRDVESGESGEIKRKYYLFSDNKCNSIDNISTSGYLCSCDNSNNCNVINENGYYINDKANIYSCFNNKNKCEKITTKEDCSELNIGELFLDVNENISLCLNYAGSTASTVLLTNDNYGNYIVYHKDGNIFGSTNSKQFVIVKVDQNSVVVNKAFESSLKYVYADKKTNKVLDKGICPNGSEQLIELNCNSEAICIETNNKKTKN